MPLKHIFAEDFISSGRLGTTWGNNGHLKSYFDHSSRPVPGDFLFLKIQGLPVPFQVEDVGDRGDLTVSFSGLDTPEKASFLVNSEILEEKKKSVLELGDLTKEVVGFSIFNEDELIGTVVEMREYPGQWMLVVNTLAKEEALIPLVENWIYSWDTESKELYMTLPDGLLS